MAYCYCDDFEPVKMLEYREIQRARKTHKCYECGDEIGVGEGYVIRSYLDDLGWNHEKLCECCRWTEKELDRRGLCCIFGGLREAWESIWPDSRRKEARKP